MSATIPAGQLDQRVIVERANFALDASGQSIATWSALVTLPVKVESVTGGETIRGRQVAAEATTLFTSRFYPGLTPRDRLRYEGRVLGIVRVGDPYGTRRELRIEGKELA